MTTPEVALVALIAVTMLFIWFFVLVDAIRRDDLSASRKIVWILAALVIPVVTIVLYLLSRPRPRPAAGGPQVPPTGA
jgi:Phospholipase_D-nuclease N-terminal